jgi:hypothetical protein
MARRLAAADLVVAGGFGRRLFFSGGIGVFFIGNIYSAYVGIINITNYDFMQSRMPALLFFSAEARAVFVDPRVKLRWSMAP